MHILINIALSWPASYYIIIIFQWHQRVNSSINSVLDAWLRLFFIHFHFKQTCKKKKCNMRQAARTWWISIKMKSLNFLVSIDSTTAWFQIDRDFIACLVQLMIIESIEIEAERINQQLVRKPLELTRNWHVVGKFEKWKLFLP